MIIENCLIILNYNDAVTTEKLINKIKSYESIDKIIIVDNCSDDNSYSVLRRLSSQKIDVLTTNSNRGYAYGNNVGALYAISKYNPQILYFANPDVEFEEEVFSAMSEALFREKQIALVAPLVKKGYNVWKLPGYFGTIRSLFLIWFTLHKKKIVKSIVKDVQNVDVVEGSFFAIKKTVFEEIDGFDERTFLYLEENILAQKLLKHGYTEGVLSKYNYLHEHSKSIKKEYHSKARAFKLFKSSYHIYLKYYLGCNKEQIALFNMFYMLAYFERMIYDLLVKLKRVDTP